MTLVELPAEDRLQARKVLLEKAGWADADVRPLAGDASLRSYQRLHLGDKTAVLMDAPPPQEDVRPFVTVAQWLTGHGLSAPELYAVDERAGFILLEDLGDGLYGAELAAGADEGLLYETAVDVLAGFQGHAAPDNTPSYDDDFLLMEAGYFTDWYISRHLGQAVSEDQREAFFGLWRAVLPDMNIGPRVLVLRDYHADNLLWLPDRAGPKRVGLLDFQDAMLGSVVYDLVSLARDIRREVSEDFPERLIQRYLSQTSLDGFDEASFRTAFAIAAVQRNTKIAGIFARLAYRDGKMQYLDYLPYVLSLLKKDLAHPQLADIRAMMSPFI